MKPKPVPTNSRFGMLTFVKELPPVPRKQPFKGNTRTALCVCDCGNESIVQICHLRAGHTTSCGCFHKIRLSQIKATHGLTRKNNHHPLYPIWMSMKMRCYNPNDKGFKNYGGRGISVCDRWKSSFPAFLEDVGPRPQGMSIERINNNLGYSKENVKWATVREQSRNRRSNVYITAKGRTMLLTDWAKELGCKTQLLTKRLKRGWSNERTVTL